MTINVTAPDGSSIDFPDETDADTIHNVMTQHFGQAQPNTALDVAKSIGSGLVKGATGAAMAGPLAVDALSRGVEAAANYLAPESAFTKSLNEGRRQAEENKATIARLTGPKFYEHTPQTVPGEYAQTGAEFLPAAVSGPGGIARRVLTQALPGAVASETAGQVFKGTPYEPYARVGGALVGGTGGALAATPRTVERALGAHLPEYVTTEHVNDAEQLINDAAQRGITLTWPEALSHVSGKPVLTDMQRLVESAGETRGKIGEKLAPRPEQFQKAGLEEFGNIAPGTAIPSMVGRETQQTARETLSDARRIINAHTEPYYRTAETVKIDPADMARVQATPGYRELRDQIRNDPLLNANVAHLPDDSVGFINEVKKLYDQQAKNLTSKFNPQKNQQKAAAYNTGAQTMRDAATKASPEYEVALQAQSQARKQFLDPLMAGPLGKLSNTPETKRAIEALFPADPVPSSQNEIATAVGAVAKRNPWAATQLVRAHLEDKFNTATKDLVGGPNQFGAAGWAKAIAANPQQSENLRAAIESLPDGQARWKTFEKFLDIAKATGERQAIGSRTAFNAQDLAAMASGGKLAGTAKLAFSPGKWMDAAHDLISGWQAGRNMNSLADIITNPRAGDTFRKLAAAQGQKQRHRLAARLIAQTATGGRTQEQ